uniref:Isopentenyl diphosphate synthase n=1 Tax=Psylliodes chrysocephalus TaxID=3402493 RepID=A0A140AZ60_9CUCU|nr:isopentenyl diphosphate synthase [Psylliodes chrysocephala]
MYFIDKLVDGKMCSTVFTLKQILKQKCFKKNVCAIRNYSSFRIFSKEDDSKQELVTFSQEDTQEFMSYFPLIVKDLTSEHFVEDMEECRKRFSLCLQKTVPNGKRVRGLTTVIAYKLLEKPEYLTSENVKLANILGWSTELVEGALIVYDDLMDESHTRRNTICWHRQEGVGLIAVADAIALNFSSYVILKKYFATHPHYANMFEFCHEIMFNTALGQSMDSIRYLPEQISMQKFKTIAKYKTGFYTFYYPVVLGMFLARRYDEKILNKQMSSILFDMGEFFQIKNDLNDCFAKLEETGKAGSDIENSKCTWLAVKALEKFTPSQRKLFDKNYGKFDADAVTVIRNLYLELKLKEEYDTYEANFFKSVRSRGDLIKSPYSDVLAVLINKLEKQIYSTKL